MDTLVDGGRALLRLLLDALIAVGRLIVDGVRAFVAHWPQLVGLFLAGWAARMAFLWLAVIVSDASPLAAVMIMPLAPFSTLLSMVLMLRALAPTLPAFAEVVGTVPRSQRIRDDLQSAAQVLIPFLGVYASAGLLKQDVAIFLHDTTMDEALNEAAHQIDFGRAVYAEGWALVGMVVLAIVLRKLLTVTEVTKRNLGWAFAGTYLEILWVVTLAHVLTNNIERVTEWILTRRITVSLIETFQQVIDAIVALGTIPAAIIGGLGALISQLGGIVVLPVAWLAIGAAVYGHSLKASELELPTREDVNRRIARIPQPVKRVAEHAVEPVTTPIKDTLTALGKIASAGIIPMVLFCVAFVLSAQVQVLAAEAMHQLVGPRPPLLQVALEPFVQMVERGAYFVVVLSLLGAAVNAIVLAQRRQSPESDEAVTAAAAPGTPAAPSRS